MEQLDSAPFDFARALRSFQSGEVSYVELLLLLRRHISAGASPDSMLDTLRRREHVDPLPGDVHEALIDLLSPALDPADLDDGFEEPPTIIIDHPDHPADPFDAGVADTSGDALPPGTELVDTDPASGHARLGVRLLELIGEGGMSRVYTARPIAPEPAAIEPGADAGPPLAVKVFKQPFDAAPYAALTTAVDQVRRLAHPNIVQLFDLGRDEAAVFLTMEYVAGRSLRAQMSAARAARQTHLDRLTSYATLDAVASALQYAHDRGIVHGDLKPSNVIGAGGDLKVIDFGITSGVADPATALTPRYASPQRMTGRAPRVGDDVYALACLAYELLTGTPAFHAGPAGPDSLPPHRAPLTARQYGAVVHGLQADAALRTPTVAQFLEEWHTAEVHLPPRPRRHWPVTITVLLALTGGLWWYQSAERATPPPPAAAPTDTTAPPRAPAAGVPATPPTDTASPADIAAPPTAAPPAGTSARPPPGTQFRDCPACPTMTVIAAGHYIQGASAASGASVFDQPPHEVVLSDPPAFARDTVSVAEFRTFAAATGRRMQGCDVYDGRWRRRPGASWRNPGFEQSDRDPVTCVSWADAEAYAAWLSARTGHRYRLPSAAEWEFAASDAGHAPRPWAKDAAACGHANVADESAARRYPGWTVFHCDDGHVHTAPVGSYQPNALGLDDMLGNVFQWTEDCWHRDYVGAPTDGSARRDGDCTEHELRGGSWFSAPAYLSSTYRNHFPTDYRTSTVGFRLVRELSP